jgi:site-specific DNA recombinase
MRTVVAYCRSAFEPQGGPSAVHSQAQAMRDYANRNGLVIRETYMDAGVSGVTLERPALQRLLADCRAGKVGTVVTKEPERLSRDTSQLVALLHMFRKSGVRVEFSTGQGRDRYVFLKTMLSAIAEFEEATARAKPKHEERQ